VVGAVLVVAAGAWARGGRARVSGGLLVAGIAGTTGLVAGWLDAVLVLTAGVAALGVATVAAHRGLSHRETLGAALAGLLSHPFGDLFTGQVPPLAFPLSLPLPDLVVLHPDPTVHLLGAMAIELVALWTGVVACCRLAGWPLATLVAARAGLGLAAAGLVLVVPPPTLDVAYAFVLGVLCVGLVCALPGVESLRRCEDRRRRAARATTTWLAAVTLGTVAYLVAYLAGS